MDPLTKSFSNSSHQVYFVGCSLGEWASSDMDRTYFEHHGRVHLMVMSSTSLAQNIAGSGLKWYMATYTKVLFLLEVLYTKVLFLLEVLYTKEISSGVKL